MIFEYVCSMSFVSTHLMLFALLLWFVAHHCPTLAVDRSINTTAMNESILGFLQKKKFDIASSYIVMEGPTDEFDTT